MDQKIIAFISGGLKDFAGCDVYAKSLHESNGHKAFVFRGEEKDFIVADKALGFEGEAFSAGGAEWTLAEETHANADTLRKLFPFTAPVPVLGRKRTVGVGDRLGIATPGHIRVFERFDATPIFAQQSIRELNLTNRTFFDVLDSASWAVFREDFTKGFGADGDHVKKPEEIEYALSCGFTMITLDCSEHIRNDVDALSDAEVDAQYVADPELEKLYLNKTFEVEGTSIHYDEAAFRRICLIYNEAVDYATSIWNKYFAGRADAPDFELSIDETATPTSPEQHFYVASEMIRRGVKPATVAPRFCGEFQKGIDYIGNLDQFKKEFAVHAAIARKFGYKISVHSGSDKFSVFETVGKETKGIFHVKTAGTNWLEAMKVIAEHEPELYREIHQYALDYAFAEARKYYHVTTNLGNIPALDTLKDAELVSLFNNNDSRQLIHITYGLILNEKDANGNFRFKDRLYSAWRKHDEELCKNLNGHIGHHLELLYNGFENA